MPDANPAAAIVYSERDALVKARGSPAAFAARTIICAPFDRLHVGVREAEMVADLVDENMR